MYPLTSDELRVLENKGVKLGQKASHVFRTGRKEGYLVKNGQGEFFLCPIQSKAEEIMKENALPSKSKGPRLTVDHENLPVILPHLDHRPRFRKKAAVA